MINSYHDIHPWWHNKETYYSSVVACNLIHCNLSTFPTRNNLFSPAAWSFLSLLNSSERLFIMYCNQLACLIRHFRFAERFWHWFIGLSAPMVTSEMMMHVHQNTFKKLQHLIVLIKQCLSSCSFYCIQH